MGLLSEVSRSLATRVPAGRTSSLHVLHTDAGEVPGQRAGAESLRRGVPLVPTLARVVQLTGAQDLRNLEASCELKLDELLVTASDGVFDRLTVDGIDPAALTNPEVYERAVAFSFLGMVLWVYKWFKPDGRLTEEQIITGMVDLFFAGLAAPGAATGPDTATVISLVPPTAAGEKP